MKTEKERIREYWTKKFEKELGELGFMDKEVIESLVVSDMASNVISRICGGILTESLEK